MSGACGASGVQEHRLLGGGGLFRRTVLRLRDLRFPARPDKSAVVLRARRLQFLIHQALAAAKLQDLEQATTCLQAAVIGSVEIGSKQRFSEAQKTYHALEFLWPNEAKLVELQPLFQERLI